LPTLALRWFWLWGSSCSLTAGWDQAWGLFRYTSCYTGRVLIVMAPDDCFFFPPSNAPSAWDSVLRVEVSCFWKCSSTSQWEWPTGTGDR
jgi:hypothetical protein